MDSTALDQFAQDTFDLSLTSLALFAFPSPLAGIRELYRTLKPGGVTALTTWKRVDWIPLLHEVEELRNPGRPKTRVLSFMEEWSVDGKLEGMMREGGFERVEEGVLEGRALWGGCGEAAFWLAKTCEMMVGEGWGVGMEEGFRSVLERGVEEVKEGREGLVVVDGEGRVGVRMVAFVGVGWK